MSSKGSLYVRASGNALKRVPRTLQSAPAHRRVFVVLLLLRCLRRRRSLRRRRRSRPFRPRRGGRRSRLACGRALRGLLLALHRVVEDVHHGVVAVRRSYEHRRLPARVAREDLGPLPSREDQEWDALCGIRTWCRRRDHFAHEAKSSQSDYISQGDCGKSWLYVAAQDNRILQQAVV